MLLTFQYDSFLSVDWKYTPLERQEDGSYVQTLSYTLPLGYVIGPSKAGNVSRQVSEVFLEDSRTSTIERFCENS